MKKTTQIEIPNLTEIAAISHDDLAVIAARYIKKRMKCPITLVKNHLMYLREQPDVIGFGLAYPRVIIVEVKVSKADFRNDAKKPFRMNQERGMGNYRYYCCPSGLIDKSEIPVNWGLLYYEDKKIVEIVKPKKISEFDHEQERYLLLYYLNHPDVYSANKV